MKLKATMTLAYEYEVIKENYPENATVEEIIAIDKAGIEDDPELFFINSEDVVKEIKIELVTE